MFSQRRLVQLCLTNQDIAWNFDLAVGALCWVSIFHMIMRALSCWLMRLQGPLELQAIDLGLGEAGHMEVR